MALLAFPAVLAVDALDKALVATTTEECPMTTDFETPAEPDDERPVVDEPDEDAPVLPEHLGIPVDLPEADALDQAQEVPLDDEEYEG